MAGNQNDFIRKDLSISEFPTHLVINKEGIIERVFKTVHGVENYLGKYAKSISAEGDIAPPPPVVL